MYLGIQSQTTTRAGVDFAIRADARTYRAIEAAHNPPLLWEMKRALPRCLFGLRLVRDVDLSDPVQAAKDFYQALRPKLLEFPYDFCSGANEMGYYADTAELYSIFNEMLAYFLRSDGDSHVALVRYGAYDFGVTWPAVTLIDSYRPGLRACDMLFMHGYKLPHNADENTIYHHRQVRAALSPELRHMPIWYSEFGLDANGNEGDGWSGPTWDWPPERYAAWLEATAAELTDVEHGIIYLGEETDPKWRSWRIVGHDVIADAMARANKREDERRQQIMPELHGRAASMAAAIGDISDVLTGPVYMTADTFYQRTVRFTYTWTRGDDMGIAAENKYKMGADGVLVEIPNPSGPII